MKLRRACVLAVCAVLLLTCTASRRAAHPTPPASPTQAAPSGVLLVLAASPLKPAFDQLRTGFAAAHPGVTVTATYQGSQALATAVQAGAQADVFAGTDPAVMAALKGSGAVVSSTVATFARIHLQLVVPAGNPKSIGTLDDLAKPGVSFVVADPSLPAGRDARLALARAGIRSSPKFVEPSVAFVLTTVLAGNADAGIAYESDIVGGSSGLTGVAIPAGQDVPVDCQIAVLQNSPNPTAAEAFVQSVLSGAGRSTLQASGFLPPA